MSNFFNMDNMFFRITGRMCDLMILNVICFLCCIPVVTIGPALTALFYVTLKMVRNQETYITRQFFKSFRQNLRQGILINLMMILVGVMILADFRILGTMGSFALVRYALLGVGCIYILMLLYVYPILAKFENTTRGTLQNALFMAVRHLPYTVIMLAISIFPFVALIYTKFETIQVILFLFFILLGGSTIAYCNSFFFVKIFDQYIPEDQRVPEKVEDTFFETAGLWETPDGETAPESTEIPAEVTQDE